MSKHGEGAWLQTAAGYSRGLPEGGQRRAVLLQMCERDQVDERLISRMISARKYAVKWMKEEDIKSSHKSVEILRSLENISPNKAASIRISVLSGSMGRPELTKILEDEKSLAQARKTESVSMSFEEIIGQCRSEIDILGTFNWIEKPTDQVSSLFGADAEYSETELDDDTYKVSYKPRWALVISPYISCSSIFGSGIRGFILSITSLCWAYPIVSVFCSSQYEQDEILKIISLHAGEILKLKKLKFHVAKP